MNEAQTKHDLIEPALRNAGWGVVEGSRLLLEYSITQGRLIGRGQRNKPLFADYVLEYKNRIIGVVEAKRRDVYYTEGVAQAKDYAERLNIRFTYSTNGKQIYGIDMELGSEGEITEFPTPDELWEMIFPSSSFSTQNQSQDVAEINWRERLFAVPFENKGGVWQLRYYQNNAITKVLEAIADKQKRILITLATGTGKTAIAFQIVWKLFHARWSLSSEANRRPRILFLAHRNILANQAFNSFSAFNEDALVRIDAKSLRKTGKAPTNGSVFFTIFQTFMIDGNDEDSDETLDTAKGYTFHDYPRDFFDLIIIDECHVAGAKDSSPWRAVLEYFDAAVQLGLTATPKREHNADTYNYFGEPVYQYSLKLGIDDGFLTPYRVRKFLSNIDEYQHDPSNKVVEGEIEQGRVYKESDFNRSIEMEARERDRVCRFLNEINPNDKTIVFCATQDHAALVRDLINQESSSTDTDYCVRVTANDGNEGETFLRTFQDNEKTLPTILTTSQKLSTGVDARNVRNIVLMRPVNSMIEFKQIVGRGTRLFDGKDYFTIFDFVNAHYHFKDPEWDGEPEEAPIVHGVSGEVKELRLPKIYPDKPKKIKIKLADGKAREIQHISETLFYDTDNNLITVSEFIVNLYGELPALFKDEDELRKLWSNPETRQKLIQALVEKGFSELHNLIEVVGAQRSDLFDVLAYIAYDTSMTLRHDRVHDAQQSVLADCSPELKDFLTFILEQYEQSGYEELAQEKLPDLIKLHYGAVADAQNKLGIGVAEIKQIFVNMQQEIYRH